MIRIGLLLVLFFTSCKTPSEYFNRPTINSCITLAQPGLMACNGTVKNIPAGLVVPETEADFFTIQTYYDDKEYRLYRCIRFGRRRCR
jgi:hypothetical protein